MGHITKSTMADIGPMIVKLATECDGLATQDLYDYDKPYFRAIYDKLYVEPEGLEKPADEEYQDGELVVVIEETCNQLQELGYVEFTEVVSGEECDEYVIRVTPEGLLATVAIADPETYSAVAL